jgi:hypothetical protein
VNCHCGTTLPPYTGRGRPRKRCPACAADRAGLARDWRASNPARVDAHNAARRAEYAARNSVERARARLRYALRVRKRVAQARLELEALTRRGAAA